MNVKDPALERRLERLGLAGQEDYWTSRYLLCNHLIEPLTAGSRQQFEAASRFLRDLVAHRWVKTRRAREDAAPKRIHYLSMEFLLGRTLRNNMMNLAVEPLVRRTLQEAGWNLDKLIEEEPDAGLGNGGLGRLAACFIDSLATLQYPAIGYGLRYEYGIFQQSIEDGYQVEQPDNWLHHVDPWEIVRPGRVYQVPLNATFELHGSALKLNPNRPSHLLGIAYDRPVVGYGGHCINTLRLWAAAAPNNFDFGEFSQGDFAGAVIQNVAAESLTRVLYPDDSTEAGRALRFLQQYFMVSCSLQDIVARFLRYGEQGWSQLPERVAIQMNDTHPALSVAELMRILLDQARLPWDEAWDLTVRTLAYTNHTLLPEALEKLAGGAVRGADPAAPGDRLRDQSSFPRRGAPPLSRRRGARAAHEPHRGGPAAASAHGPSRGSRRAQHQRGGRHPLGVAAHARAAATSPICTRGGSTTRPTASRRGAGCNRRIRLSPA